MNASQIVTLGLVQMRCTQNPQANLDQAIAYIESASTKGAQIVCLQEVFSTPYPCQAEDHRNFDFAEEIPGPTSRALGETAKRLGVVVVGSIFERRTAGLYHNTSVTFDVDGELAGFYRKMHIPDDPNYYEKFYFTPGDLGFTVAPTEFGVLGVGVCWDQWFPEAARLFALSGAQILLYPTAIGWLHQEKDEFGDGQHAAWETMMRSHAIANGVFVAATNRVGTEDGIEFWGQSFVANTNGLVLARANPHEAEVLVVECNLSEIDSTRTHWPFLRDRRIDAYGDLLKRYVDQAGFC